MSRLERWGRELYRATGEMPYLVGSSLDRRDFRDVDVRMILDDDLFDTLFPYPKPGVLRNQALWAMLCEALSVWGAHETGLPIDFQFQPMRTANSKDPRELGGPATRRNAIGIGQYFRDSDGGWVLR